MSGDSLGAIVYDMAHTSDGLLTALAEARAHPTVTCADARKAEDLIHQCDTFVKNHKASLPLVQRIYLELWMLPITIRKWYRRKQFENALDDFVASNVSDEEEEDAEFAQLVEIVVKW